MKKVYCWIKNNAMFFTSDVPPKPEWCDRYIEVEVDTTRNHIYEHDQITDEVKIIYKD